MDIDDLALRPKTSPVAIHEKSSIPARNSAVILPPAPQSRKRKASSTELDGLPATGPDAGETPIEVPPSLFGAEDEVKLLLKHLRESASPVPELEHTTRAEDLPKGTASLEVIVPLRTPPQSYADSAATPGLSETNALEDAVGEPQTCLPNTTMRLPQTLALKEFAFTAKAELYLVEEHNTSTSVVTQGTLPVLKPDVGAHTEDQERTYETGSVVRSTFFPTSLPRKSRKHNSPFAVARPIGSHASFIQQATAENRVTARWKNRLAPFFSSE